MYLTYQKKIDPSWAWATYRPSDKEPWTVEKAGHLYRRAAFGATWNQLQSAQKDGPSATIDRLLSGGPGCDEFYQRVTKLAQPLEGTADDRRLRGWWLYTMINTPHPLLEKMTLFWHNHFATSNAKVQDVGAMYRQNQLLRRHALLRFGPLLQEMSKDPAMLIWLDGIANKKGKPNENYARELMELFSLGIGHYSEEDIRQAARAFTGWTVKGEQSIFQSDEYDEGIKSIFGKSGPFQGRDVVQLCLEKECCARFLVRKLMRFLVSETLAPDDDLVEPLAAPLRQSDYNIGKTVESILRSNLFFSAECYRARIKPPVEFAVSLIHSLEGRADAIGLAEMLDPLGQRLFAPPSVKGWDGSSTWLNTTTLLLRHNLSLAITSTEDRRFYHRCDPVRIVRRYAVAGNDASQIDLEKSADFLTSLLLQGDIPETARAKIHDRAAQLQQQKYPPYWSRELVAEHQIRVLCHLLLTLPEFQLS